MEEIDLKVEGVVESSMDRVTLVLSLEWRNEGLRGKRLRRR